MIRLSCALAAGLMVLAGNAYAQLPATYTGAVVLPVDGHVFGAYLPLSSNAIGAVAQLRLSFLPGVDFGFQGGLSKLDRSAGSRTLVRMGTDLKFQLVTPSETRPIAMALGGGIGVFSGDDYNVLSVGPSFVASRSWRGGQSGEFSPYAGLGLALTTINAGSLDDNDFSMPIRLGAELGITPSARLVFEIASRIGSDFGDDTEFTMGANLPF
ncbi:MAG: hypothetical protein ABIS67_15730 [Candidatus Eisenbacteria bacterium]